MISWGNVQTQLHFLCCRIVFAVYGMFFIRRDLVLNSVQIRLGTLCGIWDFFEYCMLDVTAVLNMLIPFHVGAKNIHAYHTKR